MVASSKRWRKTDASDVVETLRRKSNMQRVLTELAGAETLEDLGFEEVTTVDAKAAKQVEKQIAKARELRHREVALLDSGKQVKKVRSERRRLRNTGCDLWGDAVVESGVAKSRITKAHRLAPAVEVPLSGQSANPDKDEWEENLLEQAAVSRKFLRLGEVRDTFDEEQEDDEEVKAETLVKTKIEQDLLQDLEEPDLDLPVQPTGPLTGYKLKNFLKKKLQRERREKLRQQQERRQAAAQDWEEAAEHVEDIVESIEVSRNNESYRKHIKAEHARRRECGESKLWRSGSAKVVDLGDEAELPEALESRQGSIRRLQAPQNLLRDRMLSLVKRGVVVPKTFRRRKFRSRKLKVAAAASF